MTKTYAQLAREIAALQASAKKLLASEAKDAITKINDLISKYGLSASDLKFAFSPAASPRAAKVKNRARGAAASGARYSDGKGNHWVGRGPRPIWLRKAIAAGQALESFAVGVAKAAAAASIAPVAAGPAQNIAAKPASRSIQSARATKLKAPKTPKVSAVAKESDNAPVSVPAAVATAPAKAAKGKGVAKAPARAQSVKSTLKLSPVTKSGAARADSDPSPVMKSNGSRKVRAARTPVVSSTSVEAKETATKAIQNAAVKKAAVKKAAVKKAVTRQAAAKRLVNAAKVPARKKAGPTSAPRKSSLANSAAPVVREAQAASATP